MALKGDSETGGRAAGLSLMKVGQIREVFMCFHDGGDDQAPYSQLRRLFAVNVHGTSHWVLSAYFKAGMRLITLKCDGLCFTNSLKCLERLGKWSCGFRGSSHEWLDEQSL